MIPLWRSIAAACRRLARQPMWRILLFLEAMGWLVIARFLLWALRFRDLAAVLELPLGWRLGSVSTSERRKNIRWAVQTAAAFLPGETVCFPKGIAGHAMCRVRGIRSTLRYGAGISEDGKVKAHVWLEDRTQGIIGHSVAREYLVIAEFPAHGL